MLKTAGSAVRVLIPTTKGPVDILSIEVKDPSVRKSVVCIDFKSTQAGISPGYDAFVKRSTGVVHRLFGQEPFPPYRMDVSQPVDAGDSWQLAILIAHAIQDTGAKSDLGLIWASAVVTSDLRVGSVGNVSEKLRMSEALFREAKEAGRQTHVFLSTENEEDVDGDVAEELDTLGITVKFVSRVDEAITQLGLRGLETKAAASMGPTAWKGNPFRGLEPFDIEHRDIFFGRARAREEAVELLRTAAAARRPFLLVHGASGCGKSSFVRAGLAGDVVGQAREGGAFLVTTMTPAGLASPSRSLWSAVSNTLKTDVSSPAALVEILTSRTSVGSSRKSTLLLVIDQLEEALDDAIDAPDVKAFDEAIHELVRSNLVWVVTTIRSDALGLLDRLPMIAKLAISQRIYRLERPGARELEQIVVAPVRMAGRHFEDPRIPDELVEIAARSPDSLPLLQVALTRFFDAADDPKVLTRRALERVGGFEGAVAAWADEVYDRLKSQGFAAETLDRALLRLIRFDPNTNVPMSRTVSVFDGPEEDAALYAFAEHRVATRVDDQTSPRIRLAHECLIQHWAKLAELAAGHSTAIAIRDQVESRAHLWKEQAGDLLGYGGLLSAAQELLEIDLQSCASDPERKISSAVRLSPLAREYVDSSARRLYEEEFSRKRARIKTQQLQRKMIYALSGLVCVAIAATFGAILQQRDSQAREALTFGARAIEAIKRSDYGKAIRYALLGTPPGGSLPWAFRSTGIETILNAAFEMYKIWPSYEIPMLDRWDGITQLSPDGTTLLMAYPGDSNDPKSSIRLYDTKSGKLKHTLSANKFGSRSMVIRFSYDGAKLATYGYDGILAIYSTETGQPIIQFEYDPYSVIKESVSPGWNLYDDAVDIAFSLDGLEVSLINRNGCLTSYVLDGIKPKIEHLLTTKSDNVAPPSEISFTKLSVDGSRLVVASRKGYYVFDTNTRRIISSVLAPSEKEATTYDFTPDNRLLIVSTKTQSPHFKIYDVASGKELVQEANSGLATVAPGSQLVAYAQETKVIIKKVEASAGLFTISVGKPIVSISFAQDGYLLIQCHDGSIYLYSMYSQRRLASYNAGEPDFPHLEIGANGMLALVAGKYKWKMLHLPNGRNLEVKMSPLDITLRTAYLDPSDGNITAANADGDIYRISTDNGRILTSVRIELSQVFSGSSDVPYARYVAGGRRILAVQDKPGPPLISLYNAVDGKLIKTLRSAPTKDPLITQDRNIAVIENEVWSLDTATKLATLEDDGTPEPIALSADELTAIAIHDDDVEFWDLATGKRKGRIGTTNLHPTGVQLVRGHSGTLFVVGRSGSQLLTSMRDLTVAIERGTDASYSLSSIATQIVTAEVDGLRAWDLESRNLISGPFAKGAITFRQNDDGSKIYIITGSNDLSVYDGSIKDVAYSTNVAWSTDIEVNYLSIWNDKIVVLRSDGRILIWDTRELPKRYFAPFACVSWSKPSVQEFTEEEFQDAVLAGLNRQNPEDRNPCLRRGILNHLFQQVGNPSGRAPIVPAIGSYVAAAAASISHFVTLGSR